MGSKLKVFLLRLVDFLLLWPIRFVEIFAWLFWIERPHGKFILIRWIAGLLVKMLDLTPVPIFLELCLDIYKSKTRPLNQHEAALLTYVFGKSIKLNLIAVDPTSVATVKRKITAYVSLHTINFFDHIEDDTLVHEAVHLWQYRKYGSNYILEALYAQKWGGGYRYGGVDALNRNIEVGLKAFNFEQQAEIIMDWYKRNVEAKRRSRLHEGSSGKKDERNEKYEKYERDVGAKRRSRLHEVSSGKTNERSEGDLIYDRYVQEVRR